MSFVKFFRERYLKREMGKRYLNPVRNWTILGSCGGISNGLKNRAKRFLSLSGQAAVEYFILFLIVALGIVGSGFLWFSWNNGQAEARGDGGPNDVRNIAQVYFTDMSNRILGN